MSLYLLELFALGIVLSISVHEYQTQNEGTCAQTTDAQQSDSVTLLSIAVLSISTNVTLVDFSCEHSGDQIAGGYR